VRAAWDAERVVCRGYNRSMGVRVKPVRNRADSIPIDNMDELVPISLSVGE